MDMSTGLNKIADALQVNLEYRDGKVIAFDRGAVYRPLPMLGIPFMLTVCKFFNNGTFGIIAHVAGDLYIIVAYNPEHQSVGAFLIDGNKLSMDGVKCQPQLMVSTSMSLKEVLAELRGSVVASFLYKKAVWEPLTLPNN